MPEEVPPQEEEYELLPHKEIEELKEELSKLKEFEIAPSKRLQVGLLELNTKLDKLTTIFEDAAHEMRVEEGGMSFVEKMRPLLEKMNKILEQNSEIASGILALADMVKDLKMAGSEVRHVEPEMPAPVETFGAPPMGAYPPQQAPQVSALPPTGMPPLPPLPRKRTFGI